MSDFNLRDTFVRYTFEDEEDVLEATEPSAEYLDELFGDMKMSSDVRIIIVGQDEYASRAKTTAMAFSYPRGLEPSDSNLSIILAANKGQDEMEDIPTPTNGYLGSWRDQGVLLINCRSSVNQRLISRLGKSAVGILLGREATNKCASMFDVAFSWGHPSAKSTKNNDPSDPEHWRHADVFWKANVALTASGRGFINWASVYDENRVLYFVDGGYSAKKGHGKAGAVVYSTLGSFLTQRIHDGSYGDDNLKLTTNNVAEIIAMKTAFDIIAENKDTYRHIIYSDSQYTINTITEWYKKWVAEKKLDGKKNIPLVKKVVAQYDSLPKKPSIKHTRGHAKAPSEDASALEHLVHRGNDHIDRLVSMA